MQKVQELTFTLCHVYAKATYQCSVSIPAPAYYTNCFFNFIAVAYSMLAALLHFFIYFNSLKPQLEVPSIFSITIYLFIHFQQSFSLF
jgi:hypothetical protein